MSTTPAADFCCRISVNYSTLSHESETCNRSPAISSTAFDTRPPDLPPASLMDTDFAVSCPLVRRRGPQIQFLSIGPYLCSTLPSDPTSPVTPLRFATLHLHQVGTGLSPASCRTCAAYNREALAFGCASFLCGPCVIPVNVLSRFRFQFPDILDSVWASPNS